MPYSGKHWYLDINQLIAPTMERSVHVWWRVQWSSTIRSSLIFTWFRCHVYFSSLLTSLGTTMLVNLDEKNWNLYVYCTLCCRCLFPCTMVKSVTQANFFCRSCCHAAKTQTPSETVMFLSMNLWGESCRVGWGCKLWVLFVSSLIVKIFFCVRTVELDLTYTYLEVQQC